MNKELTNYQQSQSIAIKRARSAMPRLAIVSGIFVLLIGLTALFVTIYSNRYAQDNRSKATGSNNQVELTITPRSESIVVGQSIDFNIGMTPQMGTLKADGIQLIIQVPTEYFSSPRVSIEQSVPVRFAPRFPQMTTDKTGRFYLIKLVLLHNDDGQSIDITTNSRFLKLTATPIKSGQTTIDIIPDTIITQYQSGDQQNLANVRQTVPFAINAGNGDIDPPAIIFPFKLQGLNMAGVEVLTHVWFIPINADNSVKTGAQTLERDIAFISDTQGWLTPTTAINISTLTQTNTVPQRYQVLVKTPVSLSKMIGRFTLETNNQTIVIDQGAWSGEPAKVGDFIQTGRNFNRLDLLDISDMINKWIDLSTAITSSNRKYDVNYDNRLNIMDIDLVISNWTDIYVEGD